jgi:transposase
MALSVNRWPQISSLTRHAQQTHRRRERPRPTGTRERSARSRLSAVYAECGRPVAVDTEDYKNRNVVERAFNHLKNWRGIATRYDKHALIYRGEVVLASILLWLS